MFSAMLIITLLTTTSAYNFASILREGALGLPVTYAEKVRIPSLQCSGGLQFPRDYKCETGSGIIPPDVLQVEVQDFMGAPKVVFGTDLRTVSVYRNGDKQCAGDARIIISLHCLQ